jgi:hypothetical protein
MTGRERDIYICKLDKDKVALKLGLNYLFRQKAKAPLECHANKDS